MNNSSLNTSDVERWLVDVLDMHPDRSGSQNYLGFCPFCDPEKRHKDDFTFHAGKLVGNCYRGFSEKCENPMNILGLISRYFDFEQAQALVFLKKTFMEKDSLLRVKRVIMELEENEGRELEPDSFTNAPMPDGVVSAFDVKGPRKWMTKKRAVPSELLRKIGPMYMRMDSELRPHEEKYRGRVFWPVNSIDRHGWLAYAWRKDMSPKTINPTGKVLSRLLFLYDFYEDDDRPVVLCEGIFDAIRLNLFGFKAMAIFGTNVSKDQIELLNALEVPEVCLCLDPDASEFKMNKKGQKTSKALRTAKKLNELFLGDTSMMYLWNNDPDDSKYSEIKKSFKRRQRMSSETWKITRALKQAQL